MPNPEFDPELGEPEFDPELGEPEFEFEQAPLGTDDPKILACLSAALGTERFEEISKGGAPPNQREREAMGFCYQEPKFEFEPGEPAGNELEQAPFGTDDPKILECLETTLGPERFKDISIGGGAPPNQREREAMGFCYQAADGMPTPISTEGLKLEATVAAIATSMPLPAPTEPAVLPNPTSVVAEPSSELSGGGCNAPNNSSVPVNAAWILLGLGMPGLAIHNRLRKSKKHNRIKSTDKSINNSGR
jgi:hypothetical protein